MVNSGRRTLPREEPERSICADLPSIELDSVGAPEPGGVGASGRVVSGGGRWGWLAVALCVALLAAIVLGLEGHPPADGAPPTSTTMPPAVATGRELAVASITGGSVAVTVRITDRPGHTTFQMEGSGGAPEREYWLELGTCPSAHSEAGVGATSGLDGQFGATIDMPQFRRDEMIWMRVRDGDGANAGSVQGRLADTAFVPIAIGERPCGAPGVTEVDVPVQFATRPATLSPPSSIGVEVLPPSDVIESVHPLGPSVPELSLGRYDDVESGITVDPAWVVVDRGVVTSEVGPDGSTVAFHSSNVVRVVNAITGRVSFTFSTPLGPVTCPLAEGASPDQCAA